jgi:hypothetical protein
MSQLIPVGYSSTAVVDPAGNTRIYYQGIDGAIHQLSGIGPVVSNSTYRDQIVIPANQVRASTPLASTIADNTQLNNVRFCMNVEARVMTQMFATDQVVLPLSD